MPRKGSDKTYGEKLISLFARLLFTRRRHSLTDLARMLDCSKQTVLRLVEDIERSYKVQIEWSMEGRKRFFRMKTLGQQPPILNLTPTELHALYMCRAFAQHLLGRGFLEEVTRALDKGRTLLPKDAGFSSEHFSAYRPGTIDYTPHHESIRMLLSSHGEKAHLQDQLPNRYGAKTQDLLHQTLSPVLPPRHGVPARGAGRKTGRTVPGT